MEGRRERTGREDAFPEHRQGKNGTGRGGEDASPAPDKEECGMAVLAAAGLMLKMKKFGKFRKFGKERKMLYAEEQGIGREKGKGD